MMTNKGQIMKSDSLLNCPSNLYSTNKKVRKKPINKKGSMYLWKGVKVVDSRFFNCSFFFFFGRKPKEPCYLSPTYKSQLVHYSVQQRLTYHFYDSQYQLYGNFHLDKSHFRMALRHLVLFHLCLE